MPKQYDAHVPTGNAGLERLVVAMVTAFGERDAALRDVEGGPGRHWTMPDDGAGLFPRRSTVARRRYRTS
jgi:hypothetical protein